jgi:GntR family transcriptional regulator, histidine utilization repressor
MTPPAPRPVLDGEGALYEQIRRAIAGPILKGDWAPGDKLPSEHELTRLFDTSRMTVNRALTALVEEGLIVRRRRAGSFVAVPPAQHPVLKINDIKAEVLESGLAYRFEVIGRETRQACDDDKDRLGQTSVGRVLAISICHHAAAAAFAFEDRLINLDAVPAAADEPFRDTPPGTWLLAHIPWTEAEHRIRAVTAPPEVRRHLSLPRGAPSLMVERRTRRADHTVTAVNIYYPGARHELVARFSPPGGAGRRADIG